MSKSSRDWEWCPSVASGRGGGKSCLRKAHHGGANGIAVFTNAEDNDVDHIILLNSYCFFICSDEYMGELIRCSGLPHPLVSARKKSDVYGNYSSRAPSPFIISRVSSIVS